MKNIVNVDNVQTGDNAIQPIPFEVLIPSDSVDVSDYKSALNQAFSDANLRNIAITGAYGSGKSSILKSYLKCQAEGCKEEEQQYKDKCLWLSLSQLHPTKEGNLVMIDGRAQEGSISEEHIFKTEQILEGKIINQILYKVPEGVAQKVGLKTIGKEAFSVSKKVSYFKSTVVAAIVCVSVLLLVNYWQFLSKQNDWSSVGVIIFVLFFVFPVAYWVCRNIPKFASFCSHIHRVKVAGSEIELFQDSDAAYFDKYLNQVLYLLENSGKKFFIFEDIDRFDTTLIFERLKEINELVNAKQEKEENRGKEATGAPIKFIYLLRDDIFLNKERTKFFDFLIPVIPVTNTNNSADRLFDILARYGLKEHVSPDLVRAIGFYIEDFRLIKNIANEFRIYYEAIKEKNELNSDKLLAIISYKNLFPKDFVDLQKRQGYVYCLLFKDGKRKLVNKRKQKLEADIKELETQLNKEEGRKYQKRIDKIDRELSEVEDESFSALISFFPGDKDVFMQRGFAGNGETASFSAVQQNEYFGLLKYLLINGYLNETCIEYTTYFCGGFLTEDDHFFLMNLHENGKIKWDLSLHEFPLVLQNISDAEMRQVGALNQSLFVYMLSECNKDQNMAYKIDLIMENFKDSYFEYAIKFISHGEKIESFAEHLFRVQTDSFQKLYSENCENLEKLACVALDCLQESELKKLNEGSDNSLSEYISKNPDFLRLLGGFKGEKANRRIQQMKLLGVCFADIHAEGVPKEILSQVFQDGLYEINANILRVLFINVEGETEEDAITKPLTILQNMEEDHPVKKNLIDHFDLFAKAVLGNLGGDQGDAHYFMDDADVVVDFIKQRDINDKGVKEYLLKLRPEAIPVLSEIEDSNAWGILAGHNLVQHSAQNILVYIDQCGMDESLMDWFVTYAESPMVHANDVSEKDRQMLANMIVKREEIPTDVYISLLRDLNCQIESAEGLDSEVFPGDKIKKLVENKIFSMNPAIFHFLRASYSDLLLAYIKMDKEGFNRLLTGGSLSLEAEEMVRILRDADFIEEEKIAFLKHTKGSISVLMYLDQQVGISNVILNAILKERLDENELSEIIQAYGTLSEETQECVIELVNHHADSFVQNAGVMPKKLFEDIFRSKVVNIELKVRILTVKISEFDKNQIPDLLILLDDEKYGKILKSGVLKDIALVNNEANTALFEALKQQKLIRGYELLGDKYRVERVPKKRFDFCEARK